MLILVLNSGSSSLKFQLFKNSGKKLDPYAKGIADAINLSNSQIFIESNQINFNKKTPLKNHQQALNKIFQNLLDQKVLTDLNQIELIGHRVVHGGEKYQQAAKINARVIADIKKLFRLAPLHNPANLAGILSCKKILPKVKQVAVFDTAFHQTIAPLAYLYALPTEIYEKHQIRRYGFHGINHKYVSEQAIKLLKTKKLPYQKLITCHLGNGCSVTAIKNGKSIETSMGYTPLEGLVMGTRSGDLDPAIPLELSKVLKMSLADTNNYLNKKSGLLGLTQISSDLRAIFAASKKGNQKAIFAIDLFAYRLAKYINSYIGVLGGIDAIVFTGGIGEHAWYIRKKTLQYLKHHHLKANQILIIPANEELEIAKQSLAT